jgi:hypothetical protein
VQGTRSALMKNAAMAAQTQSKPSDARLLAGFAF